MAHKYKPYPQYKDSGVEWFPLVPDSWLMSRLKFDSYIKARVGWHGLTSDEFTDEGPYLVTGSDFSGMSVDWNSCYHCDSRRYEQDPFIQLKDDDLLVTKDGTIGKVILTGKLPGKATLNSGVFVLRPLKERYFSKFYYWLLQSSVFHGFIEYNKTGTTISHLYQETFCNISYALPSISEQQKIAEFLDHETGKIDELIEKQERLIKLLEEKRQAVISHAVTKGLNPDAPMKDSGIEWLGEIPEHWKVSKSGFHISILSGFAFPSAEFSMNSDDTKLLRGINIGVSEIKWDNTVYWKRNPYDNYNKFEMEKGDIVIGMDRPWITEGMRVAKLSEKDLPCLLLQRVASIRTDKQLKSDFFFIVLGTQMFIDYFTPEMTGVSVPHISPEQIASFSIPLPPQIEQQQIVDYIDEKTTKIDNLMRKAKEAIELLKERRTALISAAVTGKIDVREFAVEEKKKNVTANIPFQRSVLAAEIASRMCEQNTFGRVKFQKTLALCDLHLGMDIGGNYKREAAGPFDNRMMRSIASQLEKQKWIKTTKRENAKGYRYEPMEKIGGHKQYFDKYWGDKREEFERLISLLDRMDTRQAEIVATLYSAWNDFLEVGKRPTDDELVTEVLTNWHESKKSIEPARWHRAINWMRQKGLVPHDTQGRQIMGESGNARSN